MSGFLPHAAHVVVFWLTEVVPLVEMVLGMSLVQVGDRVFRVPRCPIGSPFGKIAVSARAALCELRFLEEAKHVRSGFHIPGWLFGWVVATARYVGDLYMSSLLL